MLGEPRIHEAECESTQQLLVDRAGDLPEGAIATTDHQTAGRGRLGRSWADAPGLSVLCSILLRPPGTRQAPELSLVAAVATAETVELHTTLPAQIKWPNDVLLDRRKVAGILAEMRDGVVVLGVGINVNQTRAQLPPNTRTAAASLRSVTGREYDREAVLATLLDRLGDRYASWRSEGLGAVAGELRARNHLLGRPVRIGDVTGTGGAIDGDGRFEIVTAAGAVLIESGEVEVER